VRLGTQGQTLVSQVSSLHDQPSHQNTADDQIKALVRQNKQAAEILETKTTLAAVVSQLADLQAQIIAQKAGTEAPVPAAPVAKKKSTCRSRPTSV